MEVLGIKIPGRKHVARPCTSILRVCPGRQVAYTKKIMFLSVYKSKNEHWRRAKKMERFTRAKMGVCAAGARKFLPYLPGFLLQKRSGEGQRKNLSGERPPCFGAEGAEKKHNVAFVLE